MVVSEPLFQSSFKKNTLVHGVIVDGEFDFITMTFQMAVMVWFRFTAISTLLTWKLCTFNRMYVGQDPQKLYSESVFGKVCIYLWELRRGINSLKDLAWAGKALIND